MAILLNLPIMKMKPVARLQREEHAPQMSQPSGWNAGGACTEPSKGAVDNR